MKHGLETLRDAIRAVCGDEYADKGVDEPLDIDSILRLTLLVELENTLDVEIDADLIEPEVFDSLASLSQFIDLVADR